MGVKKSRQQCELHYAKGRDWNKYEFSFTDYRGVDNYRCIECKEKSDRWLVNYEKQRIVLTSLTKRE